MYNYHGINEQIDRPYFTPSDDMLINGRSLSAIEGYRQLHVSGRGIVSRKPELLSVPARAGAFLNYVQDEIRELEITYQLTGLTSEHLRDQFERLNNELRTVSEGGMLSVRFMDEPDWEYFAVLSETGNKPEQSLQFTDTFTLVCPDPHKYKNEQESSGKIRLKHAKNVLPKTIEATVSNLAEQIAIYNGDLLLRFNGNYNAGDKFKITWGQDDVTATINSVNKLHELEFNNYPETFFIKYGDEIIGTNLTIDKVVWRDRRL